MALATGAGRRTGLAVVLRAPLVAAAAVILAAVLVYPSLVLVVSSFVAGGRLSLALYAQLATDAQVYTVLLHSLVVSVAATAGGIILGVVLAWIVSRTDVPGRAMWRTALLLPYMIPPFIGAIAWVYLLSPVGYLNQIWMALTGSPNPLAVVYGPAGIIGVMILYGYPIVFLASLGVLERMNPVLEEAARMSRAGPWGVFWEITVPLMLPGLLAGGVLLLMSLLGDFGIPAVIGFPARYYVLTTRIYETILNFDQHDNLNLAAALSMWLVVIAAVLLWLQRWLQRRNRFAVVGGQAGGASLVTLGRWRYPVACGLGAFVTVSVVLPLAAILVTSLIRAYGLPPAPSNLTLAHYAEVVTGVPKVPRAVLNSLELAAGSATLILAMAVGFGYLLTRVRLRGSAVLDLVITIPYAIPGTVVALGMILAWSAADSADRPAPVRHVLDHLPRVRRAVSGDRRPDGAGRAGAGAGHAGGGGPDQRRGAAPGLSWHRRADHPAEPRGRVGAGLYPRGRGADAVDSAVLGRQRDARRRDLRPQRRGEGHVDRGAGVPGHDAAAGDQFGVPGRAAGHRRGDPWLNCGSRRSARRSAGRAGAATRSGPSAT